METAQFHDSALTAFKEHDLDSIEKLKKLAISNPHVKIDKSLIQELMTMYAEESSDGLKDDITDFITTLAQRQGHKPSKSLFFPSDESYDIFISKLKNAKVFCYVAIYTISNDETAAILYDLFTKGVDIRVLTDDDTLSNKGSDAEDLAKCGVPVRPDADPKARLHHKFAVIDDKYLINGSFNWTFSAYKTNYENMTITYERQIIKDFKAEFDKLWDQMEPYEIPRGNDELPYRYRRFLIDKKKKGKWNN